MAAITLRSSGNTKNLEKFLDAVGANSMYEALESYAQLGVDALEEATPVLSGVSANSWYYMIEDKPRNLTISWYNSNKTSAGVPIVVMLQYGHATGTGGYVQGRDFINPATGVVFDMIQDAVWKAVQSA